MRLKLNDSITKFCFSVVLVMLAPRHCFEVLQTVVILYTVTVVDYVTVWNRSVLCFPDESVVSGISALATDSTGSRVNVPVPIAGLPAFPSAVKLTTDAPRLQFVVTRLTD